MRNALVQEKPARPSATPPSPRAPLKEAHSPEARLIQVYQLVGAARSGEALELAQLLVRDVPNFQLAQLVYADLLLARRAPLSSFGAGAATLGPEAQAQLDDLRSEAMLRLQGLQESPPTGSLPRQFLALPGSTRYALAVDASRSRLYVFENNDRGLEIKSTHYVSLGRSGVGKLIEGDRRTPLGVYFITSRLNDKQVGDFYGPGALPLNYPNEHDRRLGRTGSGIWLHGVPRSSYARTPRATDGCVVLANDDLRQLLHELEPRNTPVVIAQKLEWVTPAQAAEERRAAMELVQAWNLARTSADVEKLAAFYSAEFAGSGVDKTTRLRNDSSARPAQIKDLSVLAWRDEREVLVVTFGQVRQGERSGRTMRQYWSKEGGQWKIFYEGVI
jgi:murein L,D-transpeptidase YafK